jgi:hypothetical protein
MDAAICPQFMCVIMEVGISYEEGIKRHIGSGDSCFNHSL